MVKLTRQHRAQLALLLQPTVPETNFACMGRVFMPPRCTDPGGCSLSQCSRGNTPSRTGAFWGNPTGRPARCASVTAAIKCGGLVPFVNQSAMACGHGMPLPHAASCAYCAYAQYPQQASDLYCSRASHSAAAQCSEYSSKYCVVIHQSKGQCALACCAAQVRCSC
jgi:hypothetical protein